MSRNSVAEPRRKVPRRILADPRVCGGDPCIAGTRIPVHVVLSHLAAGDSPETILADFPRLRKGDIDACLEYAAFLCTEKAVASRPR